MKILVTRTDRLGDVLLATPVLRRLKKLYPDAQISFWVQKPWMEILRYELEQKEGVGSVALMEYSPQTPLEEWVTTLRAKKFDVAVVLRDEKRVSWAVKKAAIPVRIGPYSTLRSFFTFNKGMFQKRSNCKMHETEYNLQLLQKLPEKWVRRETDVERILFDPATKAEDLPRSWIKVNPEATVLVQAWLKERGLEQGKYICFHPGSSGSARYLKMESMVALVKSLQDQHGVKVVLTGSVSEAGILEELSSRSSLPPALIFGGANGSRSLSELAELYRFSRGVVDHGTGPIHLAAAVGTNVFAIFPPLYVLSEKRWGPLTAQRTVWVPPVACPEKYVCRGEKCVFFDCMDRFAVDDAVKRILQWNEIPQRS